MAKLWSYFDLSRRPEQVESYEKYILECEQLEISQQEPGSKNEKEDMSQAEQWKERRECLEMLKRELSKVHITNKTPDLDYFLEDDETKEQDVTITELQDDNISKREKNK